MSGSTGLSVILGSVNPITKLYDFVRKYQKKKRIEDKLAHAFENEVKKYMDNLERICKLTCRCGHVMMIAMDKTWTVNEPLHCENCGRVIVQKKECTKKMGR